MFCKQCRAEIPDNSVFCNACGAKQENNAILEEKAIPITEDSEKYASESIPTHRLPLPIRLLLNLFILVLKVILFLVGAVFNILAVIVSLLGPLAGGALSVLGTAGLVFWLFDRSMGTVFAVTACVLILAGGIIAAAPSLLATAGTVINACSLNVRFL